MTDDLARFQADVLAELAAMREVGMHVPKKAVTLAQDANNLREYVNMRTSECADLLIALASIKDNP
jgi:hypothetical protein